MQNFTIKNIRITNIKVCIKNKTYRKIIKKYPYDEMYSVVV